MMTIDEYVKWLKEPEEHVQDTVDTLIEHVEGLYQRIAELEAPESVNGCYGCVHKPLQGENYYEPCGHCRRFFGDFYEKKDSN